MALRTSRFSVTEGTEPLSPSTCPSDPRILKLTQGIARLLSIPSNRKPLPTVVDRDDLAQQAFLLYLEIRGHYDTKIAKAPFRIWVYGRLWRRMLDFLRREHGLQRISREPVSKPRPSNDIELVDLRDWIAQVRTSDPECAELMELMYVNDGRGSLVPPKTKRAETLERLRTLIRETQ